MNASTASSMLFVVAVPALSVGGVLLLAQVLPDEPLLADLNVLLGGPAIGLTAALLGLMAFHGSIFLKADEAGGRPRQEEEVLLLVSVSAAMLAATSYFGLGWAWASQRLGLVLLMGGLLGILALGYGALLPLARPVRFGLYLPAMSLSLAASLWTAFVLVYA